MRSPLIFISLARRGSLGITFDTGDGASEKSLKSLSSLKKRDPKVRTLALHLGNQGYVASSGTPAVPIEWLV